MKKSLLLLWSLLQCATFFAQQPIPYEGSPKTHFSNLEPINIRPSVQKNAPIGQSGGGNLTTTSVSKLLSLPNAFGYAGRQKQLSALPSQNAVVMVNRQDPTVYGEGTSGHLRYTVSTDQGISWTNPLIAGGMINTYAVDSGFARYPNTILFQNGGTSVNDLKFHTVAPTIEVVTSTGWEAQVRITEQDITTFGAYTSQEEYRLKGTNIFYPVGNITERGHGSGEFWMLCSSSDTTDENMYAFKGTYDANPLAQKINWTLVDTLTANWNLSVDGLSHWGPGAIAFSPNGSMGYVAAIGDIVGGRDSIYMPVFWDFDVASGKFGNAYEVNINIPSLTQYVLQWKDSLGVPVSDGKVTCFTFDMNVDYEGNPHFFTVVVPAVSDKPYAYYMNGYMREIDIHLDGTTWLASEIARQLSYTETLGSGSPASNSLSINPSPNISRSVDGHYLFYTWTDTDTLGFGSGDNNSPDMWGRMLNVADNLLTDSINWTINDLNWHTRARMCKTSEYVFENTSTSICGKSFKVPTTMMNFSNTANVLTTCDLYYFADIEYHCEDATKPLTSEFIGVQPALSNLANIKVYPNPAKQLLNVELNMKQPENVTISLVNLSGQIVMTKEIRNTAVIKEHINVSDFASGMYFLQVSNSQGTQAQKVLID